MPGHADFGKMAAERSDLLAPGRHPGFRRCDYRASKSVTCDAFGLALSFEANRPGFS